MPEPIWPPAAILPVMTIEVYERLHARVRALLAEHPGADVYYKPGGTEAVVLAGNKVYIVGHVLTSIAEYGEWSVAVSKG